MNAQQKERAIANYNEQVKQSELAMTQSYYNGQAPVGGNPDQVPHVPMDVDDDGNITGNRLVATADVPFKYVELVVGGVGHLAILTPWKVSGGPGTVYDAKAR